ncbi:hypothetical protein [Mycolicibacterium fortuitum]|uniref:hypothetical protein n=1 Tax=Mycolicibacterium fortuitum TaxID=1766 RepID=UPI001CE054D7|nr:hypothetical protein [Mycolicibacterium fortuitum]MCA4726665.1 hypothetical protein [Mycolicibacterium fortuitum]
MTTVNRPYMFELAALIVRAEERHEEVASLRQAAARNAVDATELDRTVELLRRFHATGTDIDEWVRQEYFVDGWIHGYLPPDLAPTASVWQMAQYAAAYYSEAGAHPSSGAVQ